MVFTSRGGVLLGKVKYDKKLKSNFRDQVTEYHVVRDRVKK